MPPSALPNHGLTVITVRVDAAPVIGQEDIASRRTAFQHGPSLGKMVVGQTIVAAVERRLDGVQCGFDAAPESIAQRMEQPCDEISRQVRFQIRLCAIGLDQISPSVAAQTGRNCMVEKRR